MSLKTAVVSALLLLASGSVKAGHRVTVEKQSMKGLSGSVSFNVSQPITCADGTDGTVFAGGFLQGSQSITKQTGTPKTVTNSVLVELFGYQNTCTGAGLGFGEGAVANGFTAPDRRFNSAGLQGTAAVQDLDTGNFVRVDLDVVIQGTGPISASKSTTKTKTVHPFVLTITQSGNANRSGVASGTITIDGVELNPSFDTATLNDNVNSTITIEK